MKKIVAFLKLRKKLLKFLDQFFRRVTQGFPRRTGSNVGLSPGRKSNRRRFRAIRNRSGRTNCFEKTSRKHRKTVCGVIQKHKSRIATGKTFFFFHLFGYFFFCLSCSCLYSISCLLYTSPSPRDS